MVDASDRAEAIRDQFDEWMDRLLGRRKRRREWVASGAIGFTLGVLAATAVAVGWLYRSWTRKD